MKRAKQSDTKLKLTKNTIRKISRKQLEEIGGGSGLTATTCLTGTTC